MKRIWMLGAFVVLGAVGSACAQTYMAIPSQDKKAYVVSGVFGSDVYHCVVEGAKPICTQVQEVE